MNSSKIRFDSQIEHYRQQIEVEQRKAEEFSHDKRQEAQRKLDEATERFNATDARIKALQQQRAQADEQASTTRREHDGLVAELNQQKRNIADFEAQLSLVAQRERNKLAPYGRNMERVLADIASQQWHGRAPVGPLGQYVRVRDSAWAPVMRVRLGALMTAFAVTDVRDRRTLEQILKRHGKYVIFLIRVGSSMRY